MKRTAFHFLYFRFKIKISDYSTESTLGDVLTEVDQNGEKYNPNGMKFSTMDQDNDRREGNSNFQTLYMSIYFYIILHLLSAFMKCQPDSPVSWLELSNLCSCCMNFYILLPHPFAPLGKSCSKSFGYGGWWYNNCYRLNPTAPLGNRNGDNTKARLYYWGPDIYTVQGIQALQLKIRKN